MPMNFEQLSPLYLATHVTIEVDGTWHPAQFAIGSLPHLHVITAWNPGDARPTRDANDCASRSLYEDLAALGATPMRAMGRDPHSDHAEESWAVAGLNDARARELGAKYGQVAVFRITADRLFVLACRDVSVVSRAH